MLCVDSFEQLTDVRSFYLEMPLALMHLMLANAADSSFWVWKIHAAYCPNFHWLEQHIACKIDKELLPYSHAIDEAWQIEYY